MNFIKFNTCGCDFAPACIPANRSFGFDALSIFGGMMGNMGNMATTLMNNTSNEEINNRQLLWTANENQKNKDWQSAENALARQWQQDFWKEQFDYSFDKNNAYNTPAASMSRLTAAGYNPFGSNPQVGMASPTNQSTPIASTVGSPATQSAPSQIPMQRFDFGQGFKDIAEGLSALALAKKSGVETNRIERLLSDEVMNAHYAALQKKIDYEFTQKYGDERNNWANEKLRAEVNKVFKECALLVEQENYQKAVNKFEEQLRQLEVTYKGLINKEQIEKLKYIGKLYRSEISRNFASAYESQQKGDLDKQVRMIRTPEELRSGIEGQAIVDNADELYNYYDTLIGNDITDESVRSIKLSADKLASVIDLATLPYDKFIEKVSAATGVASDIVSVVIPIGKYKQLKRGVSVMQDRNDLKRKEVDAVDVKTTETFNSKGRRTGWTQEKKFKNPRPKK